MTHMDSAYRSWLIQFATDITHIETASKLRRPPPLTMGWLRLVGTLKLQVSFAKEPYKRNDILQKRPMIFRSLLSVANPYQIFWVSSECLLSVFWVSSECLLSVFWVSSECLEERHFPDCLILLVLRIKNGMVQISHSAIFKKSYGANSLFVSFPFVGSLIHFRFTVVSPIRHFVTHILPVVRDSHSSCCSCITWFVTPLVPVGRAWYESWLI